MNIARAPHTAVPLSEFLDPENSSSGYVKEQAMLAAQHEPAMAKTKNKEEWKGLHERVMDAHKVGLLQCSE